MSIITKNEASLPLLVFSSLFSLAYEAHARAFVHIDPLDTNYKRLQSMLKPIDTGDNYDRTW